MNGFNVLSSTGGAILSAYYFKELGKAGGCGL